MIQTVWYSSQVLGTAAVAVGLRQSVFLLRIICMPDANSLLGNVLSYDAGGGRPVSRSDQIILWQCAMGLLEVCIYTWLAGFVVFIWDVTRVGRGSSDRSHKIVRTPQQPC